MSSKLMKPLKISNYRVIKFLKNSKKKTNSLKESLKNGKFWHFIHKSLNSPMLIIICTSYNDKHILLLSRKNCYVHTRLSLISTPGAYLILKL